MCDCDVVALRDAEPPIIIELKIRLNLELILQAADRLSLCKDVYIAFPSSAALWRRQWKRIRGLCRRLGIGIITLDGKKLKVNIRQQPAPYSPRGSKIRQTRLLKEFTQRVGDHNKGGASQTKIITAYMQDALRCAAILEKESLSVANIRSATQVKRAATILQKNYYGWFTRVKRGTYTLSSKGTNALAQYHEIVADLECP